MQEFRTNYRDGKPRHVTGHSLAKIALLRRSGDDQYGDANNKIVDRSSRYGDIWTYGRTDDIGTAVGLPVGLPVGMAVGLTVSWTEWLRSQAVKL